MANLLGVATKYLVGGRCIGARNWSEAFEVANKVGIPRTKHLVNGKAIFAYNQIEAKEIARQMEREGFINFLRS